MLTVCGVVTVTVREGLLAVGALPSSAAQTALAIPAKTQDPAHTQTPLFFMTLLFAARLAGAQ
jgi:hypothetical protein